MADKRVFVNSRGEKFTLPLKAKEQPRAYPEGEPSVRWRVADLQAYAEERGIDISEATNNEERVRLLSEG